MAGGPYLGKAYVQVVASAQGIKGSITSALAGEASTAGTKTGSLLAGRIKKALVAAGIGTALIAGLKSAIAETGALQQSYLGGLDTLYGDAADKAREYARAAQQAGISQRNYSEQAVSFGAALKQAYGGDTTKALGAANKAILDMADNAAKMGTPLQSIQDAYQGFAKQNYTMLDNLKLGYGGTKTEMERLLADAQKITGIEYDISNLGDVYDAIHVIQGELGLTGVAADEAKNTLTGSFEGMKAAWANLLGNLGLGENVESSMQALVSSASNFLFNNLIPTVGTIFKSLPKAIGAMIQQGAPQMGKAIIGLSKSFKSNISTFVDAGLNLISSIIKGIAKGLPQLAQAAPKIITNIASGIIKNLPKIITTGVKLIVMLASGIIKAIPSVIAAVPKVVVGIKNAFSKVNWAQVGMQIIRMVARGLGSAVSSIRSAAARAKDAILSPIKSAINKVKSYFPFKIGKAFSGIKLPHFKVSGGKAPFGLFGKGVKPTISVAWNAKAMNNPYMFNNATLFGAGEAGDEVLYGRSALMRDISAASGGSIDYERLGIEVAKAIAKAGIETIVELDGKAIAKGTAKSMRQELNTLDNRNSRKFGFVGV